MKDRTPSQTAGKGTPAHASRRWVDASHLLTLWTFSVAQPIFDLIGKQPDFLVAQRLTGAPIAALALAGALGIPALLAAPLFIPTAATSRAGRLWIDGVRALLAAAFILQLVHRLPAAVALALTAAAGAGTALCLNRYRVFSNAVAIASVAAIVAPAAFLLRPGVRDLLPTVSTTHFEPDSTIATAPRFESDLPIVLIVFDELPTSSLQRPDGSIDERRFPSFAAFAESADWYPRAATAGLQTAKAIPALLTGQLPQGGAIASYNEHTSNLFSWLTDRGGYRVVARETMSRLCPPAICDDPRTSPWISLTGTVEDLSVVYGHLLLPPTLRTHLPSISHSWTGFRGESPSPRNEERKANAGTLYQDVPRLLDDFLQRLEKRSQLPTFYYLHLNLPHRPWKYLPSGREYTPPGTPISPPGFNSTRLSDSEQLSIQGLRRHLLQVGYADRVLGQIIDSLKRAAIYDPAMIVVVADHGHSFRPGQRRRAPTEGNVEDILEVPLFVKRPGQAEGAVFDHVVQTTDIVPTIAAALDAQPPWRVDGRHLNDPSPREISVCCFSDGQEVRTFRTDPERRQQTLDRLHRLFGAGTAGPFSGIFSAGPRPDLLGRETGEMTINNVTGASVPAPRAILAGPGAFQNVQPETGFVPSLVTGRIEPGIAAETPLAIAVNGTVRATAETFVQNGASRFSALIEERWLPAGSHEIGVFAIDGGNPGGGREQTILTTLLSGEPAARLVVVEDRIRGVELGGRVFLSRADHLYRCEIEVAAGGFRGRILSRPGMPVVPVDEYFVFDGADLLYRGQDDRSRRRVRQHGSQRQQMSFRVSLPASLLEKDSVVLLARSGDQVQVLYPPRPPGRFELTSDSQNRGLLLRLPLDTAREGPQRIPVESADTGIVGSVDGWTPETGQIRGWAADLNDLGVHQEIVAFLRGSELWVGETGRGNRAMAGRTGHSYSGFALPDSRRPTFDADSRPTARDLAAIEREGLVVYAVSRRNVAARLPFTYRPLERTATGEEILPVSDGRRLPVRPARSGFGGAIDSVARPARRTLLDGWAGDLTRGERPRQIVIYRDGEFLASLGTNKERPDVAEHHGDPGLLRTGFRGPIPGAPDPDTFWERHRVFAIMLRGAAVELTLATPLDTPP